jgi:DNA-binding transcriptional MerR regulator
VATPQEIPEKPAYKSSEVCQYTDTQPYVLRFWESEFPQLNPERSRSGQPVYSRRDIDVVMRIKQLLYDEEHTLADARQLLEEELHGRRRGGRRGPVPAQRETADAQDGEDERKSEAVRPVRQQDNGSSARPPLSTFDSVPRDRYEDAVDEIAHLRLKLKEAETQLRRAEHTVRDAEEQADGYRLRCERAIERLQQLLELVS